MADQRPSTDLPSPDDLQEAVLTLLRAILPPDLPAEVWEQVEQGVDALARAAVLYIEHVRRSAHEDPLVRTYERIMEGQPRIGQPDLTED